MNETLLRLKFFAKGMARRFLRFEPERAALRGRLHGETKEPSVIFFTVHKAGSTLLSLRFTSFFRKHGYAMVDLCTFFAHTIPAQRERFFADEKWKRKVFAARGICYCLFRYPFEIPDFEKHKIILVLRDPRDVLVSHYFSTRYSHAAINMEFVALKQKADRMDVDEYVQEIVPDFKDRYEGFLAMIGKPNVLFLRYEDMVVAPERFEQRLREFLTPLPVNPGEIVRATDFKVEREDPTAHKRNVVAGDHVRKLKPETIAVLNQRFGRVLDALDYQR